MFLVTKYLSINGWFCERIQLCKNHVFGQEWSPWLVIATDTRMTRNTTSITVFHFVLSLVHVSSFEKVGLTYFHWVGWGRSKLDCFKFGANFIINYFTAYLLELLNWQCQVLQDQNHLQRHLQILNNKRKLKNEIIY